MSAACLDDGSNPSTSTRVLIIWGCLVLTARKEHWEIIRTTGEQVELAMAA